SGSADISQSPPPFPPHFLSNEQEGLPVPFSVSKLRAIGGAEPGGRPYATYDQEELLQPVHQLLLPRNPRSGWLRLGGLHRSGVRSSGLLASFPCHFGSLST